MFMFYTKKYVSYLDINVIGIDEYSIVFLTRYYRSKLMIYFHFSARSGSQGTLDSLDLARYSEDGGGIDERVAVLEFELRKAKETINALRNNLTVATGESI